MKCSTQITLRQRIQALPQELQDQIQEAVFTSRPGVIVVVSDRYADDLTGNDYSFPPPGLLRVSHATRQQIVRSHYSGTTFIMGCREWYWDLAAQIFGPRLGKIYANWSSHRYDHDEYYPCYLCPYAISVRGHPSRASADWTDPGWKTDVYVEYYLNFTELCDSLEKEGIHVRRSESLRCTFENEKRAAGKRVSVPVEDIMNGDFIHGLFGSD